MNHGFVRVAAATPHCAVADVDANKSEIISLIEKAKGLGVSLIVFPELALCGYSVGDLLLQSALIDKCDAAAGEIAAHCTGIAAVVGMPVRESGKLYNAAAVFAGGKAVGAVPKMNIPSYCGFCETRYFASGEKLESAALCGERVPCKKGLVFEEKNNPLFTFGAEIGEDMRVTMSPSAELALGGAAIICNPSAEGETVGEAELRRTLIKAHSAKLIAGYIHTGSGTGESTTDCVFAGHRMIAEDGELLKESELLTEGLTVSEIDLEKIDFARRRTSTFVQSGEGITRIKFEADGFNDGLTRAVNPTPFLPESGDTRRSELILALQATGLERRMQAAHADRPIVGISGGLDSALALIVAVRAAKKPSDVLAITMPCFGTGSRTRSNAQALSEALGVEFKEIKIAAAVEQHFADIGHEKGNHNATFENAQARERTQVLMDVANSVNGLVVGTGDMSELALGWATYNGDHMSMYGVNGSIPKTLVKHLVLYSADKIGGEAGKVLRDIADTEISPELLPAKKGKITQKTEDILGKYVYHDFFIYYAIYWGFAPKKVMYLALSAFGEEKRAEIKAAMKLFYSRFFSQQFKRSCLPDGAKAGTVSLSPRSDLRMPSDALATLWIKEAEEL